MRLPLSTVLRQEKALACLVAALCGMRAARPTLGR